MAFSISMHLRILRKSQSECIHHGSMITLKKQKEPDAEQKGSGDPRNVRFIFRYTKQPIDMLPIFVQQQSLPTVVIRSGIATVIKSSSSGYQELLHKNKCRPLPTHSYPQQLANEFLEIFTSKINKIRESLPPISPSAHSEDCLVHHNLAY